MVRTKNLFLQLSKTRNNPFHVPNQKERKVNEGRGKPTNKENRQQTRGDKSSSLFAVMKRIKKRIKKEIYIAMEKLALKRDIKRL